MHLWHLWFFTCYINLPHSTSLHTLRLRPCCSWCTVPTADALWIACFENVRLSMYFKTAAPSILFRSHIINIYKLVQEMYVIFICMYHMHLNVYQIWHIQGQVNGTSCHHMYISYPNPKFKELFKYSGTQPRLQK